MVSAASAPPPAYGFIHVPWRTIRGLPRVTTSCGLPLDDSRLRYLTASVEVETTAKLTAPFFVTAPVTSSSTTSLKVTAARLARAGPSTAGRVAHVVFDSDHVAFVIECTVPPMGPPSLFVEPTVRRRRARPTVPAPTPLTLKRTNISCMRVPPCTVSLLAPP